MNSLNKLSANRKYKGNGTLYFLFFNNQVVAYASIAHIWSRMAPQRQRSKLAEYSVTGACVGICMTYLLGGYVGYNYGWRSIFYITGL